MTLRLLLPPSVGAARARARAELLDQSLRADLAEPVEVEVADDYGDLARRAAGPDAHLVWMPPTICARLEQKVRALYKCIRFGRATYRSAIIVRSSELVDLGQLRGKRAAWVDRMSVGGYLLALETLKGAGLAPDVDFSDQAFVGSYPDALAAVLEGRADFTALTVREDSLDAVREALASHGGKSAADRLSPLRVTRASPNDAIALTAALDETRARRLEVRVFGRDDARSRAALCLALDAEGFVRAEPGEYASLRGLLDA